MLMKSVYFCVYFCENNKITTFFHVRFCVKLRRMYFSVKS